MIASQDAEALSARSGLRPDLAPTVGARRATRGRPLVVRGVSTGAIVTVRQACAGLVAVLTAVTVARCLGPSGFGELAGGVAAFAVGLALANAGFGVVLVRELASRPHDDARLAAVGLRAQLCWSLALAVVLAGAGIATGGVRGHVMAVLAPALALGGVAITRQIAAIRRRGPLLLVIDLGVMLLLCGSMTVLAVRHASIQTLAIDLSAWTCAGALPGLALARRSAATPRPTRRAMTAFAAAAVPMGLAAGTATVAFVLELILLGTTASARTVGEFGVAVAFALFAVALPGVVLVARARTFVGSDGGPAEQNRIAAALVRVVAFAMVPLAALIAAGAHPLVAHLLGPEYLAAVPLIRVLMIAAVLASAAAVAGILAISAGRARHQAIATAIGVAIGAAGGVALAPSRGPIAAAWAAVAAEAVFATGALVSLRGRIALRDVVTAVRRAPARMPTPDRHRGAVALAAAGAAGASLPGLQADPSGAAAAAAALLGGRIPDRPQVGEARRSGSDRRTTQILALAGVAAAALVLVAVAAADLRDLPGQAPLPQVARTAAFSFRYTGAWAPAKVPVAGESALVPGGGEPPVELAGTGATLAAGTLRQSAAIPGGVPPALVHGFGAPSRSGTASIDGHAVSVYGWDRPGGGPVVAYVLATATADAAIVCAGASTPGLQTCERVALGVRLGAVAPIAPGRPVALTDAIDRAVAPAAAARSAMHGLAQSKLSERVRPANAAAAADRTAAAQLASLAVFPRDRSVVDAVRIALTGEGRALSALAAAATTNDPRSYRAAAAVATSASVALQHAAAGLTAAGLGAPAFGELTFAAPPVPRKAPVAHKHRVAPASHKTGSTKHGAGAAHKSTARHSSAPVVHQTAPVVHQTAPVVHQTAPVVHPPAPVVHQPAPVVHPTAPVVHRTAPVVHQTAPVVHHAAPVVHPTAPVHHATTTPSGTGTQSSSTSTTVSHPTTTHSGTTTQSSGTQSSSTQTSGTQTSGTHTTPPPTVVETPTAGKHHSSGSNGSTGVTVVKVG